jgi:hypothetical protein
VFSENAVSNSSDTKSNTLGVPQAATVEDYHSDASNGRDKGIKVETDDYHPNQQLIVWNKETEPGVVVDRLLDAWTTLTNSQVQESRRVAEIAGHQETWGDEIVHSLRVHSKTRERERGGERSRQKPTSKVFDLSTSSDSDESMRVNIAGLEYPLEASSGWDHIRTSRPPEASSSWDHLRTSKPLVEDPWDPRFEDNHFDPVYLRRRSSEKLNTSSRYYRGRPVSVPPLNTQHSTIPPPPPGFGGFGPNGPPPPPVPPYAYYPQHSYAPSPPPLPTKQADENSKLESVLEHIVDRVEKVVEGDKAKTERLLSKMEDALMDRTNPQTTDDPGPPAQPKSSSVDSQLDHLGQMLLELQERQKQHDAEEAKWKAEKLMAEQKALRASEEAKALTQKKLEMAKKAKKAGDKAKKRVEKYLAKAKEAEEKKRMADEIKEKVAACNEMQYAVSSQFEQPMELQSLNKAGQIRAGLGAGKLGAPEAIATQNATKSVRILSGQLTLI